MALLTLGAEMARPSRTGGKTRAAKTRKAGPARGRNPGKTNRRIAPTAIRLKRAGVSDLGEELKEAREQQAATAEILKVIASSPDNVQPAFEAIAASAKRLMGGYSAAVFRFIDGVSHLKAFTPTTSEADEALKNTYPMPIANFPLAQQAVLNGDTHQIPDTETSKEFFNVRLARARGFRSIMFTPLMHQGRAIGIRFLPPQVADLIVASGTEKQLESHRQEITALFCDLRGFTGFSEASAPEDVMALLRDYHAAIGEIIIKYSGTLERYAGDGVMVVFNDPVPVDNPALRAVLMALETREAMGALMEKWRQLGHDVGFGIGIAHGFATLGTIGFEGRFDYAAIGTVSNVASRLCDEAKPGQILISPRVFTAVKDAVTVEPVGEFTLKGIGRPLGAYNVIGAKPAN